MLESGLAETVGDEEELARFLFFRGQFNQTSVKAVAFLPELVRRETSISRHGSKPIGDLWALGRAAASGRNLKGAAVFIAGAVREAKLTVRPDEPPPRHAAIRNWPWFEGNDDETRAAQLELAGKLAAAAGAPLLVA